MNTKRSLALGFALALMLAFSAAFSAFAQDGAEAETLFPVEILNRTDGPVTLVLVGRDTLQAYALTVSGGETRAFTLRPDIYDETTFACGDSADGELEVSGKLRLVFTHCPGEAVNAGAPTQEKVHLTDAPDGIMWRYQYTHARLPAPGPFPVPGGACTYTATEDITIYSRPSTAANVFSEQPAGFSYPIVAQTADGWLGLEPGVAQAANIGEFRLRWIEPGTGTLSGDCSGVPVVWGPPPGICFLQWFETINVYALPDTTSAVAAVLHFGEFAAILGHTADGNWLKVDLGPGNTGWTTVGWVPSEFTNVNGPCGSLPVVSP
jgi:hypothetical protein